MNVLDELNERLPVVIERYWENDPLFGLVGDGWDVSINSGWRVSFTDRILERDDDSEWDGWLNRLIGQRILSAKVPEPGLLVLALSGALVELWHETEDYEICVVTFSDLVRVITPELLGAMVVGPRPGEILHGRVIGIEGYGYYVDIGLDSPGLVVLPMANMVDGEPVIPAVGELVAVRFLGRTDIGQQPRLAAVPS